jgi:hypothetical protein
MNIIETPKTTSECLEQLKQLRCELSLQTLRSYAAKGLIPKSATQGGGRGAQSSWHAETVPEAVAASKLLAHQRLNFERVAEIRRIGRHIEKIIVAEDIEKTLFDDPKVRKFTTDSLTAFRLSSWLQCKWRAMKQLDLIRESGPSSRRPEPYHQVNALKYLIRGPIFSDLTDIANKETLPVKGEIVE